MHILPDPRSREAVAPDLTSLFSMIVKRALVTLRWPSGGHCRGGGPLGLSGMVWYGSAKGELFRAQRGLGGLEGLPPMKRSRSRMVVRGPGFALLCRTDLTRALQRIPALSPKKRSTFLSFLPYPTFLSPDISLSWFLVVSCKTDHCT